MSMYIFLRVLLYASPLISFFGKYVYSCLKAKYTLSSYVEGEVSSMGC